MAGEIVATVIIAMDEEGKATMYTSPGNLDVEVVESMLATGLKAIEDGEFRPPIYLAVDNTIDSGVEGLTKDPGCHHKGHDCRECEHQKQCLEDDLRENPKIYDGF